MATRTSDSHDGKTGVWIEKVQRTLVERDLDRVPFAGARVRAEAPDERGPRLDAADESLETAIVADVLDQLSHVVGDRLPGCNGEVNEHVWTQRLSQLCPSGQTMTSAVGDQSRIF